MPQITAVTNPSPKSRFQDSADNISKHRQLVDLPEFQRASDFALLEYNAILLMQGRDLNSAAIAATKLQGAHEFLQTFRNLSEKPQPLPPRVVLPENLNHAAQ